MAGMLDSIITSYMNSPVIQAASKAANEAGEQRRQDTLEALVKICLAARSLSGADPEKAIREYLTTEVSVPFLALESPLDSILSVAGSAAQLRVFAKVAGIEALRTVADRLDTKKGAKNGSS